MLWAAIFPSINVATDPAREVIRRSVEQYVRLVDEHPNVVRFLMQGRFAEQSESAMRALNEGRGITLAMADMFNNELREMELDGAAIELAAFATFGTAASATDWWLGAETDSPRRMPPERVRRAPDDDHGRRHQRHLRAARHQDRPRSAAARGRPAPRIRRLNQTIFEAIASCAEAGAKTTIRCMTKQSHPPRRRSGRARQPRPAGRRRRAIRRIRHHGPPL